MDRNRELVPDNWSLLTERAVLSLYGSAKCLRVERFSGCRPTSDRGGSHSRPERAHLSYPPADFMCSPIWTLHAGAP